jgi:3-dehydroquinate synthase
MAPLDVELGERSYPIWFDRDPGARLGPALAEARAAGRRVAVVTDAHVQQAVGPLLAEALGDAPVLALPPGEGAKEAGQLLRVWEFLAAARLDRTGIVVAVGGGVVGDLAGFAAASYLRGVDLWQVPTTLLAMVDSSVGGKTGLNLPAGKNLVGAFHQPRAVFVLPGLLQSLPPREFAAGVAEVIKYGLLGDADLFGQLVARPLAGPQDERLASVVRRCCALKAAVVRTDERETAAEGGRALLNLGHTFGHAIEQATGYTRYLHGEAVAIGLAAAARLSVRLRLVPVATVDAVEAALQSAGLPVTLEPGLPLSVLQAAAQRDKKVRAGRQRFVVLEAIGRAATRSDVDPGLVEAVWREVGAV